MNRTFLIFLLCFFSMSFGFAQLHAPLKDIKDPPLFSDQLNYTASLLSLPKHEFRILVYGQSISAQDWWKEVKAYVEKKYPATKIVFENKAIGGFSSERLKLTVANDVVSFYPDLILFHDYGNEDDYEKIIQIIQTKTTADIAIQTDHMAGQNQDWHNQHSNVWMPALCRKYGLALIDVRKYWKAYLQNNNLQINDLLTDGVHLNEQGNHLMAAIINKYFDNLKPANRKNKRLKFIKINKAQAKNGSIKMQFTGNRIDLQAASKANGKPIQVLLDGKPPESNVNGFYYTRPALQPGGFFLTNIGLLLAVKLTDKTVEEDWSLIVTAIDSIEQKIAFTIKGSHSGEDGIGNSGSLFTSNSGKIILAPEYWFIRKSSGDFGQFNWLKPGDTLHWQVKSMCINEVKSGPSSTQTIIQGIKNGTHELEIKGAGLKRLKNMLVYTPPLPE